VKSIRAVALLGIIPVLACISDHHTFDPTAAFSHAHQSFVEGHLATAQTEAHAVYMWCLVSNSGCVRQFQILEATVMLWRGSSYELLRFLTVESLAEHRGAIEDTDSDIKLASLRATALIHLARLSEAARILDKAEASCVQNNYLTGCGDLMLARGQLALGRDEVSEAETLFESAISVARRDRNSFLQATALLSVASVATRREHFDEAVALDHAAYELAESIGAKCISQTALGDQGWSYEQLGNSEKALEFYSAAEEIASSVGDTVGEIDTLTEMGDLYAGTRQLAAAESSDLKAIALARTLKKEAAVADASMDLAQVYISLGRPEKADKYAADARTSAVRSGSAVDMLNCDLVAGQAAMLRHDSFRAAELLQRVALSPDSQRSMKWNAYHALGNVYEMERDSDAAERAYAAAIALVEDARADLKQGVSQLTFLGNASSIYDDYIHLLVSEGKTQEALEAADWSRARPLQLGLELKSHPDSRLGRPDYGLAGAPKLRASEIAKKTGADFLFYWLGEKRSYLWVVSREETRLINLPPSSAILPTMQRYRRALLALKDPVHGEEGNAVADGSSLYQILVAPAASQVRPGRPVVLLLDGELGRLNFETLMVLTPKPHFWIEDATVLLAPSIRMYAEAAKQQQPSEKNGKKLLLFGDAVPTGTEFGSLPLAPLEMDKVKGYFPGSSRTFQGREATSSAYLTSQPERFEYIHFVTHGTSSRTDPLESAVILSQSKEGGDSYKLYARDILRHPIDAQLVTISACNSSGAKSFAGEGMVGLAWAFLRAGAHNAIGSLWEVSDASTPELMDNLYAGIQRGEQPASALRAAKLSLIHSGGRFSRPFYWAPFQLYAGR
jgi:CHAT domain-containing protein/tetratricopeptide (TPR) repeat protein